MTTQNSSRDILIKTAPDLQKIAKLLGDQPVIAVDTESNSLYAYRERVCLIQFSTLSADFLVDPLALDDLSPLAPIFENPRIEKVFHAVEYDLIGIQRDFGFRCVHLFDTMLAARILGRSEVGLGSILEAEFGVRLDKRQQRADWGERPLSQRLLDYARLDTHYLIPLRDRLEAELRERGLLQLAREDFQRAAQVRADLNGRSSANGRPLDCWRVSGAHDLEPQQAAVLQELCRYRDGVARNYNRPLFKVINDRTLLAIAATLPTTLDELSQLPGMSNGQMQRHGSRLLQAVGRGLGAEPLYPPRPPRPNERYLRRLDLLRTWRKQTAEKMEVPSDIVLPRELMNALAEVGPHTPEELSEILHESPWRLENFGPQILDLLNSRKSKG